MSSYISSPSMSEHGVSRSSSVPSSSLVIEHFLNGLMMIAGLIESHAVLTHCITIGSGGVSGYQQQCLTSSTLTTVREACI